MTDNVVKLTPRKAQEEMDHEEYLAIAKRQALECLDYTRKEVEEGRICGLLILGVNPPDRDGFGYKMLFNDVVVDYSISTIGMLERVKMSLHDMKSEEEPPEIEPVPTPPDT